MAIQKGWPAGVSASNEGPKSPWGGGSGDSGSGSGGNDGPGTGGPRNPWAFPPDGRRGRPGAGALDELLRRARRGGGGGGGTPGLPGGLPGGGTLWLLGIGLLVLLWVAVTSIHPIGPQERGLVTFLGRYTRTLEPGIGVTLPAPFSQVIKVDVTGIRTETFPTSGENLMLTHDQNIVDVAYSVRWDVVNPQNFEFEINKPEETVRAAAESAMRAVVANSTLNDTIGGGRPVIEAKAQDLMQRILDEYHSGVRIEGVAIQHANPPQAVDEAFKRVLAAQQKAEALLNQANAYAQQKIASAQGEAAQFDKLYDQYKLAPEVTRRRLYYETMERVLARSNKTILDANNVTPYLGLPPQGPAAAATSQAPAANSAAPATGGDQ